MLRSGASFFYHPDGLGSIRDLTDSAGTVAKSYTYDSFGTLLAQPGTLTNPYTYTGREADPETGLYYYRARYYDSGTGRFLQEDPVHFFGGDLNMYRYVLTVGLGPRFPGGLAGGPGTGAGAAYTLERATRKTAQIIVSAYRRRVLGLT